MRPLPASMAWGVHLVACLLHRPWLRNPFNSIHAIAIANLAEMTSGIAGLTAAESVRWPWIPVSGVDATLTCSFNCPFPPDQIKGCVGIPVELTIVYKMKGRGRLSCQATVPAIPSAPGVYPVDVRWARLRKQNGPPHYESFLIIAFIWALPWPTGVTSWTRLGLWLPR